jgi:hypothetical protein
LTTITLLVPVMLDVTESVAVIVQPTSTILGFVWALPTESVGVTSVTLAVPVPASAAVNVMLPSAGAPGSVLVRRAVPKYPGTLLPPLSWAVTVTVNATPETCGDDAVTRYFVTGPTVTWTSPLVPKIIFDEPYAVIFQP